MNHTLRIGISREVPNGDWCPADGIVNCHRVGIRERLLRLLLGRTHWLTILVPGDSVKSLSIVEEGGEADEQDV
jgi:hypothetical protein